MGDGSTYAVLLALATISLTACRDSQADTPDDEPLRRCKDAGSSKEHRSHHRHDAAVPAGQNDGGAPIDAASAEVASEVDATADSGAQASACRGDIVLETDADVAAIAQCTEIEGSLTITGEELSSLDLPVLKSVSGFLHVQNSPLRELA